MPPQDNQSATKELIKLEEAPEFSEEELQELNEYLSSPNAVRIAPSTAANFLTLYLEGRSVEQIHKRFPQWPKGALLRARHEYGWDLARQNYVSDMTKQIAGRMSKVKAEVVHYLIDSLAITHKEFAREMEIYLQNPCKENLPRNRIKSLREYRDTIKTLGEALNIGQPAKAPMEGAPSVAVQVNAAEGSTVKITSGEQSNVLRALSGEEGDEENGKEDNSCSETSGHNS